MDFIQESMTSFAMLGAGWVMWLLVFLSVIGLAIVLERAYYLFTTRDDFPSLKAATVQALKDGDVSALRKHLDASRTHEARIALAGAESVDDGAAVVEERISGEASLAKLQMERNLAFLGTVGNNAPFVGLLGTVIGIIRSFVALQQGGGQVTDELFYEVGEALVATAIGILVAIPAVAAFNLFQRISKARLMRADSLGRDIVAFAAIRAGSGSTSSASAAE